MDVVYWYCCRIRMSYPIQFELLTCAMNLCFAIVNILLEEKNYT